MPDVHARAGCVIGFTGDLGDKVIANIVGVDFHAFNEHLRANVPSGMMVRENWIDKSLKELNWKNFAMMYHQMIQDTSNFADVIQSPCKFQRIWK